MTHTHRTYTFEVGGDLVIMGHFMVFVLCRTGHLQPFFHHRNYSGQLSASLNWSEASTIDPLYRVKKLNIYTSFFIFNMTPESLCRTGQKVKWVFWHVGKV